MLLFVPLLRAGSAFPTSINPYRLRGKLPARAGIAAKPRTSTPQLRLIAANATAGLQGRPDPRENPEERDFFRSGRPSLPSPDRRFHKDEKKVEEICGKRARRISALIG